MAKNKRRRGQYIRAHSTHASPSGASNDFISDLEEQGAASGTSAGYQSGLLAEPPPTSAEPQETTASGRLLSRITRWLSGAPHSAPEQAGTAGRLLTPNPRETVGNSSTPAEA